MEKKQISDGRISPAVDACEIWEMHHIDVMCILLTEALIVR